MVSSLLTLQPVNDEKRRGEFEPMKVVAICDYILLFISRKLKNEILRESFPVAFYLLIQAPCGNAGQLGQVCVQHHPLSPEGEYASLNVY
jgi:hypothetical protein